VRHGFGEHLDVVFEAMPMLEPLQHAKECADIHVDGPIAGAVDASLGLKSFDCFAVD